MTASKEPPSVSQTIAKAVLAAIPYVGGPLAIVYEDSRARYIARVGGLLQSIADATGTEQLSTRLAANEEVEALFLEGLDAATRSGLSEKRQLLAKVIAAAVLDDAEIEPGQLVVHALRDLDAPHVRALARIRKAEDDAFALADETEGTDLGRISKAAGEAGGKEPISVVAVLVRTGVVLQATVYDGGLRVYRVSEFGRNLLTELEGVAVPP